MAKTKVELSNALKELSHEKPFESISISDITSKCDLNRQTFYYHFQDKYECLEWIYRNECLHPFKKDVNQDNWNECLEKILIIMLENKEFYVQSIKSNPRVFMSLFMETASGVLVNLIDDYNNDYDEGLDKHFVSQFFATGIIGVILNWVFSGMKMSPNKLTWQLKLMAKSISNRRK